MSKPKFSEKHPYISKRKEACFLFENYSMKICNVIISFTTFGIFLGGWATLKDS